MKKYYKKLDVIRVLSCLAILFYHLGILKGGYLAVCTFFVLSGYLSVKSCFKKKKFSFKDYYLNKLKKIYLPLLIVVFTSITIISLFPDIFLLNLKPETRSILFGYNNYWQLNANLDYFVRHINSPFIHLWYIAILIQFDIVFPFIFLTFKKLGEKIHKLVPCIISLALAITSYIFFFILVKNGKIMEAYYGTFTRAFSLMAGVTLGFVHNYYKKVTLKDKNANKAVFGLYILALLIIYLLVGVKSDFFSISMIITTLISIRLIDYSMINDKKISDYDKMIHYISGISYEVYLIQYPVIFIFQDIKLDIFIKIPIIILITILLSYLISYILEIFKKEKRNILRIIISIIIVLISIIGLYQYITTEDHTEEMKKLERDLNKNQEIIKKNQTQYEQKKKDANAEWEKVLEDLDNSEKNLRELVKNLNITGIGDSIMELAVKDLYKEFPNGYFDAATNRTERQANDILIDLKNKNMLGDVVVLNIGTNGDCSVKKKETLMKTLEGKKVFWVNATRADCPSFNEDLDKARKNYPNVEIIDWVSVAKAHPEYLISDRVHPNVRGCKIYANTIFEAIYNSYLNDFNKKKEEKINEHNIEEKSKLTFIGNELLLGVYKYIENDYNDSEFIIKKDLTYPKLKQELEKDTITNNIVLVVDKSLKLDNDKIEELLNINDKLNLYIITLNNDIEVNPNRVKVFNYKDKDNLMSDGKHLKEDGNKELSKKIKNFLKDINK